MTTIPYCAITVIRRLGYPGRPPMYTVAFTAPPNAARVGSRVETKIDGVIYAGKVHECDRATGRCEAHLFEEKAL
jgi:hypothetical protein